MFALLDSQAQLNGAYRVLRPIGDQFHLAQPYQESTAGSETDAIQTGQRAGTL